MIEKRHIPCKVRDKCSRCGQRVVRQWKKVPYRLFRRRGEDYVEVLRTSRCFNCGNELAWRLVAPVDRSIINVDIEPS